LDQSHNLAIETSGGNVHHLSQEPLVRVLLWYVSAVQPRGRENPTRVDVLSRNEEIHFFDHDYLILHDRPWRRYSRCGALRSSFPAVDNDWLVGVNPVSRWAWVGDDCSSHHHHAKLYDAVLERAVAAQRTRVSSFSFRFFVFAGQGGVRLLVVTVVRTEDVSLSLTLTKNKFIKLLNLWCSIMLFSNGSYIMLPSAK
jgi:hypothetical protein